jgi:hypothetical protein
MLKRLGIPAFILLSAALFIGPTAALAQRGYYDDGGYGYQRDRDRDRCEEGRWREREREQYRAQEWRESREHEWREREWREHERQERRFDHPYRSNGFYFGYRPW